MPKFDYQAGDLREAKRKWTGARPGLASLPLLPKDNSRSALCSDAAVRGAISKESFVPRCRQSTSENAAQCTNGKFGRPHRSIRLPC